MKITPMTETNYLHLPVIAVLLGGAATMAQSTDILLDKLPAVVGEKTESLPLSGKGASFWQHPDAIEIRQAGEYLGRKTIEIDYKNARDRGEIRLDYKLPAQHMIAERLRFWIHGNGTGDVLQVSCYDQQTDGWILLTTVPLTFSTWQHLEIPAGNPIYLYYETVSTFRFEIVPMEQGGGGDRRSIRLSEMEFVSPDMDITSPNPASAPSDRNHAPKPAFITWGEANQQHIRHGAEIGINIHMAPIASPGGTYMLASEKAAYADNAVNWCREVGIIPGIAFYNHPGEWIESRPELLVQSIEGGYKGPGSFTSPWNPVARELWREHIVSSLQYLRSKGTLEDVELVMLCPGEESEVSFEWSHVWAFDSHAVKAYQAYLRTLYRDDISELNRDWADNYDSFDQIKPPTDYYPDRAHWVFTDFYRLSMLQYSVYLADAVREVHTPKYWLWLVHSVGVYPQRYYSARYPLFYFEGFQRLGLCDYAQVAALDWQSVGDIDYMQKMGATVIGEIDVIPSPKRLEWTFAQVRKFHMDGVYIGILDQHSAGGELADIGVLCRGLIRDFRADYGSR